MRGFVPYSLVWPVGHIIKRELPMGIERIKVTVEGISPLLQNQLTDETQLQIESSSKTSMKTKKKQMTPREAAESVCYRDNKGEMYQPSTQMFAACINAGKYHKIGRKQLDRHVAACFTIEEQLLYHGTNDFEVDSRWVRNPFTKGVQIKHRPRFDQWKLTFHLLLDDEIIDVDTAYSIVQDAGRRVGIGDFRPQCRGPFGKFVIVEWCCLNGKETTKKKKATTKKATTRKKK